jgi:hypothetical protein
MSQTDNIANDQIMRGHKLQGSGLRLLVANSKLAACGLRLEAGIATLSQMSSTINHLISR